MEVVGFLIVLLINIVFATFIGNIAKEKQLKFWKGFFVSFFMGPVVGLVYILVKCTKNEQIT